MKITKQNIMNFIGAHPRLVTLMAGIGISFTLASVGRIAVHEVIPTTFQIDYIDKTPISGVPGLQDAYAAFLCKCDACGASEFAPGIEAENPGDASESAPGIEAENPGDAKDLSPGQLNKKEID